MGPKDYRDWHVIGSVTLNASASSVWELVGCFFNVHKWHHDIQLTEFFDKQTDISPVRRVVTSPNQPKTVEELVLMNNDDFHYRYNWYAVVWGERLKNYVANIRVFAIDEDQKCIMQWSSTFRYTETPVSEFYCNGFFGTPEAISLGTPNNITIGTQRRPPRSVGELSLSVSGRPSVAYADVKLTTFIVATS
jgi:Polyketide cyclase / dehydrase and lipid transport